jgi:two-component system, NtrC family, sensor kinase
MALRLQLSKQSPLYSRPASPHWSMKREFQFGFVSILIGLLTVAAIYCAWLNFQKEKEYSAPYDGVWWVERQGAGEILRLYAKRVDAGGPAERAGIKEGDELVSVGGTEVTSAATLIKRLYKTGVWSSVSYSLLRGGVPVEVSVILTPADRALNSGLRLIALVYLGIGLYVLLRRWTAPKSAHFYIFCLVSFIFYSFKYTGKLNLFDESVYWANVVAWLLQPALFLHFSLTFPETKEFVGRNRWLVPLVYLPALLLLGLHITALQLLAPSELLRFNLDRLQMLYLAAYFAVAAGVLWHSYRRASTPILRQQMKLVTRGTFMAITPFTLFYVMPYLHHGAAAATPNLLVKLSVLSLVFLPLTFGYAIVRYRLMDVDIIFKRGMAYTLATAAIVGLYFGAIGAAAELIHARVPSAGPAGLVVAIVITALLFEPVKKWIQERLDRFFYRKRYDYRRTLVEFGRDLSSETDLDKMFTAVIDRLSRTLLVDKVAVFVADNAAPEQFTLGKSFGLSSTQNLDLGFLSTHKPEEDADHIFFENPRQAVRETESVQHTIAQLDLNYYIPCRVQDRVIAVLGLGKTMEGDFLSSEDVQLLETLAGYLGIAIQNAKLYASLEQKVSAYERLKDFNENIVESISVGVMAVDLSDRIESWNSQMEVMQALPRSQVLGRPISEIMPTAFVEEFYRVRQNPGIHNLYKFRLGTSAGDTRIANIAIAPLVTKKFSVIGRLIIVDDITERMELESQLSQAEKMSSIGLLAAGVAHEVNTPLAVISSYAQMLTKQLNGDANNKGLLDKITQQTFRASEIVNNLLNFSRTSGSEFAQLDINNIIKDTLALLEHQFKKSKIKVQSEQTPDLPLIFGNAGKLQQVFLNLFLNAKDAMPHGGTLSIRTYNGSGINVEVTDTGSGIAQEHIARIYDPFFTTKTGSKDDRRGTGLGLSVTYGIIQEHAGKIRVESAPGEGTTFHLEFPMVHSKVDKVVNVAG